MSEFDHIRVTDHNCAPSARHLNRAKAAFPQFFSSVSTLEWTERSMNLHAYNFVKTVDDVVLYEKTTPYVKDGVEHVRKSSLVRVLDRELGAYFDYTPLMCG